MCECEMTQDSLDPDDDWHYDRECQTCGCQVARPALSARPDSKPMSRVRNMADPRTGGPPMTAPANPPPTPTTPADAGTPPDPMRDVLNCIASTSGVCRCMDDRDRRRSAEPVEVVRHDRRRLASVERERDAAAERLSCKLRT
jgi:hypothetical protein